MFAREHTGQNQSQRSGGKLRFGFWISALDASPASLGSYGFAGVIYHTTGVPITVPLPYYPRREFRNDPFLLFDGPQPVGLQPVEDAWILGGSSFPFT
jgi:hypothetical protein